MNDFQSQKLSTQKLMRLLPLRQHIHFFPIIRSFASTAGIEIELSDISLAARILATFADYLPEEQRVPDALGCVGCADSRS